MSPHPPESSLSSLGNRPQARGFHPQDNIGEAVIKAIQPYIDNEEFQQAAIAKVSKACTSICPSGCAPCTSTTLWPNWAQAGGAG